MEFNEQAYNAHVRNQTNPAFSYRSGLAAADFAAWQRQFREALARKLGLDKVRAGAAGLPLEPQLLETVRMDGYVREKITIQTEPGVRIPFYLLLPDGGARPLPLVIAIHGHGKRGKETFAGNYASEAERISGEEGERNIGLQAVKEGYAVIVPDQRGFGEMARETDRLNTDLGYSCEPMQRKALMYGRTLIGERVHDTARLIDYAAARAEIDSSRIAVTGNSGGGTTSLFAAALDERIKLAVPGSYFCTFADSVLAVYHCSCNIIPGIMELGEMYDIAALIAPRPLLVVHGRDDGIFPIEATRRAFGCVQEVYRHLQVPDRCELYVGDGGHRYYKKPVWPFVYKYFFEK